MEWNIVTDSSCDLLPGKLCGGRAQLVSVPFTISVGKQEFVDDEGLDTGEMLDAMERSQHASHTACPSPQRWLEQFERAHYTIALTISSRLSGSMNSAVLARDMALERCPERKIAVVDSRSTGPEIALCVERICALIESGAAFEKVIFGAEAFLRDTHIAFALSSFNNLVKNGRMSRLAGFVATRLGLWGIGVGSDEGTIAIRGKTRGSAKAIGLLLDEMDRRGFRGGRVQISHCHNFELAEKLRDRIRQTWKDVQVTIAPTRGLCSYYAERGGLILSY